MQRRTFLKGAVASVFISSGTVWQACAGNVRPLDSDPELEPWRSWRGDGGRSPLALVRAAILASNAHNTQPWRFDVSETRIDLYADRARNTGAADPFLRDMHLSIGCALENLVRAGAAHGYHCDVEIFPGRLDLATDFTPEIVASIALTNSAPVDDALYDAIPNRRTYRGLLDPDRPLPTEFVETMLDLGSEPDAKLFVYTSAEQRQRVIDVVEASNVLFRDAAFVAGQRRWIRSPDEMHRLRDGFSSEPDPATKGLTHAQVLRSAPMFGLLAVRDRYDRAQALRAGRAWERINLLATSRGIASHPDNAAIEMVDYERRLHLEPNGARRLARAVGDQTWEPTMLFYLGYSAAATSASARRPVAEVLMPPTSHSATT